MEKNAHYNAYPSCLPKQGGAPNGGKESESKKNIRKIFKPMPYAI